MEIYKTSLNSMKSGNFNLFNYNKEELKNISKILDETGRTVLHWAAFLGCKEAVLLLLDSGADPMAVSTNDEDFQAIHFAAVNNHIDCIEVLLERKVSLECCDKFRRTPLSVACFYGRITMTVFLLSKGADLDHRDINGSTVLHLAALSSNTDLCQILIYSGVNVRIQNDLGETCFHLASCKGSTRMIKAFLNVEPLLLNMEDNNGMTGVTHAKGNSNKSVYKYLLQKLKTSSNIFPNIRTKYLIYGGGGSRYPLLFLILTIFFWGVPSYLMKVLFQTYSEWSFLNLIFIFFGLCFVVNLYVVVGTPPGFLPRFTKEYDQILKRISSNNQTETEILVTLSRLCHSCRTVRPVRAFHCGICRRCVRDKDHHCPYLNNCVGLKNRGFFLFFLIFVWIEFAITIFFCYVMYVDLDYIFAYYEYFGLFLISLFFVFVNLLLYRTFFNALRNITTNESLKWTQYGYDYLRNETGTFRNPFNKGYLLNILDFFRIIIFYKKSRKSLIEV